MLHNLQRKKDIIMKKGILLLLLFASCFVNAQSLKDALYGGKLKNEPGTVIRKGDDLSTKIDTVRKATTEETANAKVSSVPVDSLVKTVAVLPDSTIVAIAVDSAAVTQTAGTTNAATTAKDNNAVWKEFMDAMIATLKTEALPSKKIKNGSYYVLVSYAIGTDGQVTFNDVFVSPENDFLQQQVKQRLDLETPRLTPVLSSTGAPRKVNKKYNFTLVKE